MSDIEISIDGIDKVVAGLKELKQGTPPFLETQTVLALQPIQSAINPNVSGYPVRPPTKYVRTGDYGRTVGIAAGYEGSEFVAKVGPNLVSTVSYAEYLRGNMDGYPGAWMHVLYWQSILSISNQMSPAAAAQLQAAFEDFIKSLGLSD